MVGFKVRAIVCDGATPNRKFYRLHSTAINQGVCHFTTNLFCPERRIYFFCDVPHLLKTTRNNLENSKWHNKTRNLHHNGQSLQWTQIVRLVENDTQGLGLRLLPKITAEHLYLTPTLRMRVKLAAQILSSSTANALELIGRHDTQTLCLFIRKIDTFFDCLNVKNLSDGIHDRKPAMLPYRNVQDWRFEWLEKEFFVWLEEWEANCQGQPNLTQKEKNKLCLSRETLKGYRITVNSFLSLAKELLSLDDVKFLLSHKFNQDPLEAYFSKQRGMGGRCDNPTVRDFQRNALALHVTGSPSVLASDRGNCQLREIRDFENSSINRRKRHSR